MPATLRIFWSSPRSRSSGGTRLIFDHHDISPELYSARTGRRDAVYYALRGLERLSFRAADVVISTNESFGALRSNAAGSGRRTCSSCGMAPICRDFRAVDPDPGPQTGKPHLLAYAGVMGRQDGIDHALRALAALKQRRDDWHAILVGDGRSTWECANSLPPRPGRHRGVHWVEVER